MKTSEIRSKTVDELVAEVAAIQKERFNLRMQQGEGTAEDSAKRLNRSRQARREIAQIKTILNEKKRESHE